MKKEITEQTVTEELFKQMNKKLNEAFESSLVREFLMKSQHVAKERKTDMQIGFIWRGKLNRIYILDYYGKLYKGEVAVPLGSVKNDSIYQKKIFEEKDLANVLKTNNPTTEVLVSATGKKNIAALVLIEDKTYSAPYYNKKEVPTYALLIDAKGCQEIVDMIKKHNERQEDKKYKPVQWTEKDIRIVEFKEMFKRIRQNYKEYKKEYGDKMALELTETVQKLSDVPNFQVAMRREYGSISRGNIQFYLYVFLLDFEDRFGFVRWMKNNKQLVALYNKFHPGKEIE